MKNPRLNFLALTLATVFLSFGFAVKIAAAQIETTAKTIVAAKQPVSKNSAAIKSKETSQIIVTATSARIRKEPVLTAETLQTAKIGTIYTLLEQNDDWFKVRISRNEAPESGWISKTIAQTFSNAKRGEIYQKIADKYLKQSSHDFASAVQVFDFLTAAKKEVKDSKQHADLSLKRLLALRAALKKVSSEKQSENPFADFLKSNENEIVYSDPSGEWLVRGDLFWELHEKYKILQVAEEIAWEAAQNPIPGECEGYINCYLYLLRATEGEYLNFYPNGKYSRQALKNITNFLEPIAADSKEKAVYTSASDISDRADFNRYLTELRAIVSKTSHVEKSKTLQQIKQIGEAHR
jgi:hypothetical protein